MMSELILFVLALVLLILSPAMASRSVLGRRQDGDPAKEYVRR
jgi:hypothetical protein